MTEHDSEYIEENYNHQDRKELKEFNLSDKMPNKSHIFNINGQQEFFISLDDYAKFIEDVKEFIRLSKEDISKHHFNSCNKKEGCSCCEVAEMEFVDIIQTINKLAGDKLVDKK